MRPLRVIFMGTPDFAVPALVAIAGAGHVIAAVYCQPPRPAGRGQKARNCPVQEVAVARGWPVATPGNFKDPAVQAAFAAFDADVAVVAAYGLILPARVLSAPHHGCLNIHASLLPRWRGAAPIQRALLSGDDRTGITIMQMAAGLDSGPLLAQDAIPIAADDTAGSLHDALAAMGARMIVQSLAALAGGHPPAARPQDESLVTYAAKLDKAEARIDWGAEAAAVSRQIRAFAPWPGAWFDLEGERIKTLMAQEVALDRGGPGTPGLILDDRLTVACGSGAVRLTRLQRAGKGALSAEDFLRGFPLAPGRRLA